MLKEDTIVVYSHHALSVSLVSYSRHLIVKTTNGVQSLLLLHSNVINSTNWDFLVSQGGFIGTDDVMTPRAVAY